MTDDRACEFLFEALNKRKNIKSNTISGIRTRWLKKHGLDFMSHSLRGASAVQLWELGVELEVIASLGDWVDFDSFLNFYFRVTAGRNVVAPLFTSSSSQTRNLEEDHSVIVLNDSELPPNLPLLPEDGARRRRPSKRTLGFRPPLWCILKGPISPVNAHGAPDQ